MNKLLLLMIGLISISQLSAQEIEVYETYDSYESNLIEDDTKTYVINYWATWCAPCVKELPYFEQLNAELLGQNIEVVLVSIDFNNQRERRLIPFLKKKELASRVIHLADPKPNDWIDRVDPSWSGAIPATVFVKGEKKLFMEREFPTYESLKSELDKFIKS